MKLLAIETSCDETAISVLSCEGDELSARFTVLGNALLSQIDIHKEYGGVFPALAKREHAKNLVPVLVASLEEADMRTEGELALSEELRGQLQKILERETGLAEALLEFLAQTERPDLDAIAVTAGPGLEPALWVGINFARALSAAWNLPIVSVNHMEGHLLSALASSEGSTITIEEVSLPVLGLLISGGHTELVLMKEWLSYELLGSTRDDAVGEAFDKVARMLDLPYPGGPEVSKLAERNREDTGTNPFKLPRPMIDSGDLDFSFSGLKTAVLYLVKDKELTQEQKEQLSRAFEDAATDVLWKKTIDAIERSGAKTVVLGGGVSANIHIRREFANRLDDVRPDVMLRIPSKELTTDNAVMIGMAGYYRALRKEFSTEIVAKGNRPLAK